MLELIIALALTTYHLKKKDRFTIRVVIGCAVLLLLAEVFPVIWYNAIYSSLMFLALFGFALVVLSFCYHEPIRHLAFCGVIAYTAQHVAYETYNFFVTATGISTYGSMYGQLEGESQFNPFALAAYFSIYAVIYWAFWAVVTHRIRAQEELNIGGNISRLFLSSIIILVDIVLNAIIVYSFTGELNLSILIAVYVQSVLCCVLAVGIQLTMLDRQAAVREGERIQTLWELDRKQYEYFRENVDLINIKCHDLKHQIRALRTGDGEVDKESLREIETAISVYNCKVETGNQVLDTILAEKSLLCEYEHIRLVCMVDGRELNFISASDLYSLFGNAISNAIEAVKKTDDLEKRLIHLSVVRKGPMIVIHLDNYCPKAETLVFKDGLPMTTKEEEAGYHGYGMRSMRMLAEKLGGGLEANVKRDIFNLNIFIPASV